MNLFEFTAKVRLLIPGTTEAGASKTAVQVFGILRSGLSVAIDQGCPVLSAAIETSGRSKMLPCEMETVSAMIRQEDLFEDPAGPDDPIESDPAGPEDPDETEELGGAGGER